MQKWQCVEDATGTLELHKCKGPVRPGGRALSNLVPKHYSQGGEACSCDGAGHQLGLPARRKFFKKSECGSPGGPGQEGRARRWVAPFRSIPQTQGPGSWGHSGNPDVPPIPVGTGRSEDRR